MKDNVYHPCCLIGIASYVALLISVALKANGYHFAEYLFFISLGMGGIHWLWSTIIVLTNKHLHPQSRILWTIVVMLIPPVGGLIYFMVKRKNLHI